MKRTLSFLGLLCVSILLILCNQSRSAEVSVDTRVALALTRAKSTGKASTTNSKPICFCAPNCPCGPDCPCPTTGGFRDPTRKIPVSQANRSSVGCSCGSTCTCQGGECGDPACPTLDPFSIRNSRGRKSSPGPIEWAIYEMQYNKAIKENKPLLIWVGETCPACENSWTQYIHARLSEYDGTKGTEKGPEVMVCKPDGLGGMNVLAHLDGIPSKSAVEAIMSPQQTQTTQIQASIPLNNIIPQQLVFQPTFPMMGGCSMGCGMPMMGGFGGFGGGMMGGFGGGFGGG